MGAIGGQAVRPDAFEGRWNIIQRLKNSSHVAQKDRRNLFYELRLQPEKR